MLNYVDSCITLEVLYQDSGLLPKPTEDWSTFVPQLGDIAHVDEDDLDYGFNGTTWIPLPKITQSQTYFFDDEGFHILDEDEDEEED